MFSHMNTWMIEKNSIKHNHEKKKNCSHLGMEDITDGGYTYGKSVYKDFEIGILENILYACLSRCI